MGGCLAKPLADVEVAAAAAAEDATGGLADMYEVKHLLGSGSAGDTWLCRDRATGELLAVKLMKRPIPSVMGTNIMREVKIGAQLGRGHLNIVKPRELILTRTHLGIVMDYVAGGNMADYILKTILLKFGSFDTRDGLVMEEDEARYFFSQILNAVEYCHANRVAHRDLKMDNTLLDEADPPRIKLCDFGFAKWWTQEPCMSTITGTPDYMSPQLLGPKAGNQAAALYDGTKADIWAAGVMLCVMLIGRFPFEGVEMSSATNLEEVSAHVWRQQNSARWHDNPLIAHDCFMLSPDCIDLLNSMFDLDEGRRITISDIRQHPWFDRPLPPPYDTAYAELQAEQARIEQQVKSGGCVSKDRDAALHTLIALSASAYSPQEEHVPLVPPSGGSSDGGTSSSDAARSLLRRVSLSAIQPFSASTSDVLQPRPHLSVLTSMMAHAAAASNGEAASGAAAADVQQQQQAAAPQAGGQASAAGPGPAAAHQQHEHQHPQHEGQQQPPPPQPPDKQQQQQQQPGPSLQPGSSDAAYGSQQQQQQLPAAAAAGPSAAGLGEISVP